MTAIDRIDTWKRMILWDAPAALSSMKKFVSLILHQLLNRLHDAMQYETDKQLLVSMWSWIWSWRLYQYTTDRDILRVAYCWSTSVVLKKSLILSSVDRLGGLASQKRFCGKMRVPYNGCFDHEYLSRQQHPFKVYGERFMSVTKYLLEKWLYEHPGRVMNIWSVGHRI